MSLRAASLKSSGKETSGGRAGAAEDTGHSRVVQASARYALGGTNVMASLVSHLESAIDGTRLPARTLQTVYAARAGMECFVFMPEDTPIVNRLEAGLYGAKAFLVNGLINDCGAIVREGVARMNWFDFSTLKEPYRLEGKKTMGLELAEQMGWTMPDILLYPTGGGTGLVGIPKGYEELRAMGWVSGALPRIVAVQAEGCAPVVKALHDGAETTAVWENPTTHAAGLRVPSPFAGRQMLKILRDTRGDAIAVSEGAIEDAQRLLGRLEGVWTSPEGAALVAALGQMKDRGAVAADARIVLVLTGAGIKYDPPPLPAAVDLAGSDDAIVAAVRRALGV